MNIRDNFEEWAESTFSRFAEFEDLDKKGVTYWSRYNRLPLLTAILLSMGLNPHAKEKRSGKLMGPVLAEDELKQRDEFINRLKVAQDACKDGYLIVDMIPSPCSNNTVQVVDREVDIKSFIFWARENFQTNFEPFFELALNSYKSSSHAKSGGHKGSRADKVKEQITEFAIAELDSGCKCHHSELARVFMEMKNEDGLPRFTLPSIITDRYYDHFCEATTAAFQKKGIPLRNEPKTEPRGRKLCLIHPLPRKRR